MTNQGEKVGPPKVGELPPLKHWRSSCETTLAGHTIIARENEAPYAYTCAGSAQEICDAVNNYRAEQQVSAGLRARLDGRFEQLALMSGRAIYAEQLLEKAEASLAEANAKIAVFEAQEAPEKAWERAQSSILQAIARRFDETIHWAHDDGSIANTEVELYIPPPTKEVPHA